MVLLGLLLRSKLEKLFVGRPLGALKVEGGLFGPLPVAAAGLLNNLYKCCVFVVAHLALLMTLLDKFLVRLKPLIVFCRERGAKRRNQAFVIGLGVGIAAARHEGNQREDEKGN